MKWLKRCGIVLLVLYILLTFKIQILKNHDVYIRIIPSEKIEYLFISGKMKKALKEFERNEGICKKLNFSNKRILFSKDKTIYEIILENNKAETKKYIPEYSYTVEDTFNLKLNGQDSDYFQMVCFLLLKMKMNYIPHILLYVLFMRLYLVNILKKNLRIIKYT